MLPPGTFSARAGDEGEMTMKAALFLVLAVTFAGCHATCARGGGGIGAGAGGVSFGPQSSPQQTPSRVVAVKVTRSGEIYFDKRRVTLDELAAELGKLPKGQAGVCYYREGEPHPVAVEAMGKIAEARLPVTLSAEECE